MLSLCCDVGTGSVRVAIFQYGGQDGKTLKSIPLAVQSKSITTHNPRTHFYEQNTKEIWAAFCECARKCLASIASGDAKLKSIAFSATCSLVIVDKQETSTNDVILWMDHRAVKEAQQITDSGHIVLKQFGGVCSPEFSIAKLLWLKHNEPRRFETARGFMELPDWLTYRCSTLVDSPEDFPRSLCSVTCKWGYDALGNRWPWDLFSKLGLDESYASKLGTKVHKPGINVGNLSFRAAQEIGLASELAKSPEVSLASSLIDAHSGALAMMLLASRLEDGQHASAVNYENIFCMIAGTSTCHMVLNRDHLFTRGVWGPYLDVIVPGYYLREAGQSATGKLLEHVVCSHSKQDKSIEVLVAELNAQLKEVGFHHETDVLVNPTFHGNRSPIANPHMKGAIYGLTLEPTSLMDLYVATIEAIIYETRYIIEEIERSSQDSSSSKIQRVIVSGGLSLNEFFLQTAADILNVEVITFGSNSNLMLIGGAVLAFAASEAKQCETIDVVKRIDDLKVEHSRDKLESYLPRPTTSGYHGKKYKAYRKLVDCCLEVLSIMATKK